MAMPKSAEEEVFNAARRIGSPEARREFVENACGDDQGLQARVEALLRVYDQERSFLQSPVEEANPPATSPVSERFGTVIGPYKLLEQIGEGGFGVVFMAEQQHPVRRQVALKVLKPGMDTRQVVARFEAERQALALMDHPNIAHVLDAGETAQGRPYFVMELVRGVPVTDFCDQNHLPVPARLELFVTICQAVQHAHQKGIIHRDIKPSNLLVTLPDPGAPGVVKVIDFGIAKAVGQKLTEKTLFTHFALVVGTPLYMSPEQAEMSGLDIDTRTDIYALGVLLYELLTGATPVDRERLGNMGFDELRRVIREEEPAKPSARISTVGAAAVTVSSNRQSSPQRLSRLLRGDLDWIVMKCLEKDRTRRYDTASGLARDIQRYLNEEPVEACPPSAGYRLRKFARRHRKLLCAAGAFALLLTAGAVVSTWLAVRATLAEGRAHDERETARAAQELAEDRYQLARESVDQYLGEVTNDPDLKQKDFNKLRRKLLEAAVPFFQKFAEQKSGDPALEAARGYAYHRLAFLRGEMGDIEAALADCTQVQAIFEKLAADFPNVPDHRLMAAASCHNQAQFLERIGKHPEAEAGFRAALTIQERLVADVPGVAKYREELSLSHNNLASLYARIGKQPQAEEAYRAALTLQEKLVAEFPTSPPYRKELATTHYNLGCLLTYISAKHAEAEDAFHAALAIEKELVAEFPANPAYRRSLASSHNGLGILLAQLGKPTEDEFRAALEIREKLAADFPTVPVYRQQLANSHNNLGRCLAEMGNHADAEAHYRAALAIKEKLSREAPNVPDYAIDLSASYVNMGHLLQEGGKADASLEWYDKGIATLTAVLAQDARLASARLFSRNAHRGRAAALQDLGRHAEAVKDWERAIDLNDEKQHEEWFKRELGANLLKQKKHADAEPILRECLANLQKKQPEAWTTFHTQSLLGAVLLSQQKYADAEPLLLQGYQGMKEREAQIPKDSKDRLTEALERLVQLYDAWGKPAEADKWRKQLPGSPRWPPAPSSNWEKLRRWPIGWPHTSTPGCESGRESNSSTSGACSRLERRGTLTQRSL